MGSDMAWKKVALTLGEVASGENVRLQNAFDQIFLSNGAPKDATAYARETNAEPFEYFYSPLAAEIAAMLLARYGAVDCDPPDVKSLVALTRRGKGFGRG